MRYLWQTYRTDYTPFTPIDIIPRFVYNRHMQGVQKQVTTYTLTWLQHAITLFKYKRN